MPEKIELLDQIQSDPNHTRRKLRHAKRAIQLGFNRDAEWYIDELLAEMEQAGFNALRDSLKP